MKFQTKHIARNFFTTTPSDRATTFARKASRFSDAGLVVVDQGIWTRQVERTWEICRNRVERTGVRYIAKILGKNHTLFLNHFDAILNAYRSGAMEYGYFIAEKSS